MNKTHLIHIAAALALLAISLHFARSARAEERAAAHHTQKIDHLLGLLGRGEYDYPETTKRGNTENDN